MQSRETGGNISSSRNETKKGNSGRKALQLAVGSFMVAWHMNLHFIPHIPL